jgi:hypothetical protein
MVWLQNILLLDEFLLLYTLSRICLHEVNTGRQVANVNTLLHRIGCLNDFAAYVRNDHL